MSRTEVLIVGAGPVGLTLAAELARGGVQSRVIDQSVGPSTTSKAIAIQPRTLEQVAGQAPSVFLRSYPSLLIGSFAFLAFILAMIGLYGVISYSVLQRTREIGIRVAIGAQRPDVLRLVLREGIATAGLGIAAGVIAGLFLTRLMSSLLYGVTPGDWLTFTAVSACLLLVAVAACAIPARRAAQVDPIIALRYE